MPNFTPLHADRTLPLVRRIARDLVGLQSDLRLRQAQIDTLLRDANKATSKAHAEELAEIRMSLDEDQRQMLALQEELASIGAMIHSPTEGVIDFPAQLDSRPVRLCWRIGEEHVSHWHEVQAPLGQRRPITDEEFAPPVSAAAEA
ncbi:DUF2203 domain-containing protein [Candidatus Laterigemmans baculatus]|uniref:DUF2203 domain-containing protein n=1 Tax=Candidatus Laterigemmans baculatus TaxID=2770505 RepID=UPI0013DA620B|nr:DUF2203 domain-containing protein [Candidatus Laterigemmans baculatus]